MTPAEVHGDLPLRGGGGTRRQTIRATPKACGAYRTRPHDGHGSHTTLVRAPLTQDCC